MKVRRRTAPPQVSLPTSAEPNAAVIDALLLSSIAAFFKGTKPVEHGDAGG